MSRLHIAFVILLVGLLSSTGQAQVAGGEVGYDESLEAVGPTGETPGAGLAGSDPADIGRYLLAQNGGVSSARLSPDGETVAFLWSITGEAQVWTMPATGGQPQRLTYGTGIRFFRWTPGGDLLYGADDDGNEQEAYFRINAAGTDERRVLPAVSGGFRVFGDFLADDTIAYASTERNRLDYDLYVADLSADDSEGGEPRLVFEGTFGFFVRAVSPDGHYAVVSETVGEDSDNLYLLDLQTGDLDTLSKPERRANHTRGGIAWVPDGSGFYLATNLDRDFAALAFYRIGEGFQTIETPEGDVESVRLCGEDGRTLVWSVNDGGYSRIHARNLRAEGDAATLDVPDLPEGVYGLHCTTGSDRLAITVNGWQTPGSVVVWDLDSGAVHQPFTASLGGLDPERLVRPQSITLPARDGVTVQGLLYLPDAASREAAGTDDGPPPVVFFVHGGPTAQSRPTFDPVVQYHVVRGLAFFEPNVRGSTGFGHTYVTLDDQERRLDSVRDLVDMLTWLGDEEGGQGLVDADRAAVVGGSYGGYAVNAVLAAYPGHFAAGAALYGVADWVTALEVASPGLKASDRIEYGDITEPRWRAFYEENSPIRQADRIDVPVLYSHGARDPRIDIAETEVMVRNLRARGVPAPYVRFLDEGHGWRKLANRLFYYRYQATFLEDVLGVGGDGVGERVTTE
ncbi:MAG: prolyl oligopeptidase family serine peptidase [Bacteroidota bacterium]